MKKRELESASKQSAEELNKKLTGLKLELKKISVKISSGEENNLKLVKNKRREIAQLATLLNNKKGEQK